MPSEYPPLSHSALRAALQSVLDSLHAAEARCAAPLGAVHPIHVESARNLAHYVALRGRDLRPLQDALATAGLSSLGRSEAGVLASVQQVIDVLGALEGRPAEGRGAPSPVAGRALLGENTTRCFGPERPERSVRIIATLPTEAAQDPDLVRQLMLHGMDCARINTAHDTPELWRRMIAHVRAAEAELGQRCLVLMELAGPKLRTRAVQHEPRIVRCGPGRDRAGKRESPTRVHLLPPQVAASSASEPSIPVPTSLLETLRVGDRLHFKDLRNKQRRIDIVEVKATSAVGQIGRRCYIGVATQFELERGAERQRLGAISLGQLPREIRVRPGDLLVLAAQHQPEAPWEPPRIGIDPPTVFDRLAAGNAIWFDDGKIGGQVERVTGDEALVRITSADIDGTRVGIDKGVNLPGVDLGLPALSAEDRAYLDIAAAHADIVGLSFVNRPEDVADLRRELAARGATHLALMLKIETQLGFRNLPQLLFEAMQSERVAVMIARGDLAVECGFERLAEVQEEILWLCEAARVPAVWATQVLERLTKKGQPSRAEITDASSASRAEAVMLNKGPHVTQALATLDDILRRMQAHVNKKTSLLRPLHSFSV